MDEKLEGKWGVGEEWYLNQLLFEKYTGSPFVETMHSHRRSEALRLERGGSL